jgi:hypothetical protein
MDKRQFEIDGVLTSFALGYKPQGLIADIVCPRVYVDEDSGNYYEFGTEKLKSHKTIRAPKTGPNLMNSTVSSSTYKCNQHSLGDYIDALDIKRAKWDAESGLVEDLMDAMYIDLETEVYDIMKATGSYASSSFYETLSGSDQIDAEGGGPNVKELLQDAALKVKNGCGRMANTLVIPIEVGLALERHYQIEDLRKHTVDQTIVGLPSRLFGLNVIIAGSVKDAAREGQTKSLAALWSDYMWIMYLDPNPGWRGMAFLKNFTYRPDGLAWEVHNEPVPSREMPNKANFIEVFEAGRDPKAVGTSACYMYVDCLV